MVINNTKKLKKSNKKTKKRNITSTTSSAIMFVGNTTQSRTKLVRGSHPIGFPYRKPNTNSDIPKSSVFRRIKKGGIILNKENQKIKNFEEGYTFFIKNSEWEVLNISSLYGVIFKCKLNKEIKSPFNSIRIGSYGEQIREIIIKLVLINDTTNIYDWVLIDKKFKDNIYNTDFVFYNKSTEKKDSFVKEINIQIDITEKTIEYLEPVCPFIIFSKIYNYDRIDESIIPDINSYNIKKHILNTIHSNFFNRISNLEYTNDYFNSNISYPEKILYQMIFESEKRKCKIGLIAMENIGNGVILENINNNKNYLNYSKFEILNLALNGYNQGDFHKQNILIDENYENYFKDTVGRAFIIDYGRAEKLIGSKQLAINECWNSVLDKVYKIDELDENQNIDDNIRELINELINDLNYIFILILKSNNKYCNMEIDKRYNWIKQNGINEVLQIYELYKLRELSKKDVIKEFNNMDLKIYKLNNTTPNNKGCIGVGCNIMGGETIIPPGFPYENPSGGRYHTNSVRDYVGFPTNTDGVVEVKSHQINKDIIDYEKRSKNKTELIDETKTQENDGYYKNIILQIKNINKKIDTKKDTPSTIWNKYKNTYKDKSFFIKNIQQKLLQYGDRIKSFIYNIENDTTDVKGG